MRQRASALCAALGFFLLYIPRFLCLKSLGLAALCAALALLCLSKAQAARERRDAIFENRAAALVGKAKGESEPAVLAAPQRYEPLKALSWPVGLACALSALSAFFILGALLLIGK